ncbi:Osmotin, thaumatin-like protein [Hesseltinella vesiculosa]|uniref:Osmotin, thaumatin-like protein n=1 Tax=Hesseltinella vesiculosa TaxID=101127 RepID=A0A1X2G5W3_9FUNG|nr:Osmotin, thaumatin-like protein [Hesseltinella vesiculosa]
MIILPVGLLLLPFVLAGSRSIDIVNNCPETLSIGVLTNGGSHVDQRFDLTSKGKRTISQSDTWGGRLFGQPQCVGNSNDGKFCGPAGAGNPASLAEFFFKGANGKDYYDVSLVDGYNLPMAIQPHGGQSSGGEYDCGTPSCKKLPSCPSELTVKDSANKVIGCQSSCSKTGQPQYCCSGAYDSPSSCKADSQANSVKSACPDSYSWAYDDQTSTFVCMNPSSYTVTFC